MTTKSAPAAIPVDSDATDRLTRARTAVAGALDSAAQGLHDKAEHLPGVATASSLAHGAADRLQSTASYVREHGAREMAEDVKNVIRAHPGKALLAAVLVGFVTARAFRE